MGSIAPEITNLPHESDLWTGPSKITIIKTGKCRPMNSLLKPSFEDPTGFCKGSRQGPVHLGHSGFENDERAYVPHRGPDRAVLQYNPDHYPGWKRHLKADTSVHDDEQRDALLVAGGFGENIIVENTAGAPPMDETTMCVGDMIGVVDENGVERVRICVTGPRIPCYKIDHRFGVSDMSQRVRETGWPGWLYSVDQEGSIEVGNSMVLLARPFPEWPVSRIQHYCFKDTRNLEMMRQALAAVGHILNGDILKSFNKKLTNAAKPSSKADSITDFRLCGLFRETFRVSDFSFERVNPLPTDSEKFAVAEAGSHVRLHLKINGRVSIRPYSVISGNSNKFRLGVALAANSRGGSSFMHENLKVGDVVQVSEKFANTFPLVAQNVQKHIFVAGGIGITAFLNHIEHCIKTKQQFHLHYMIHNKSDHAFRTMIEEMVQNQGDVARVDTYISADGNRCNLKHVLKGEAENEQAHIYICGSDALVEDVKNIALALRIKDSRIHVEQFSIDATGDPFEVETSQTKKKVAVNSDQSLLEALRDAGFEVGSSCESGNCGTCKVRVKCGKVLHRGTGLLEDEKAGHDGEEAGEMLACVSRGVGRIVIEI